MAKSAAVLVLALFSVGDAFSPAAMPRGVMRQSAVSLRCSAMPPSTAIDRRRLGSFLAAGALSLALPKQDALAATEAKKKVKPQGPAQALDMIIAMKVANLCPLPSVYPLHSCTPLRDFLFSLTSAGMKRGCSPQRSQTTTAGCKGVE
jgi:hypothetical protein